MYIKVKVEALAKKEMLTEISSDHFAISVKEPAKRNLANKRVQEIIAHFFNVPAGKVKIISGHHSPGKIFCVDKDV